MDKKLKKVIEERNAKLAETNGIADAAAGEVRALTDEEDERPADDNAPFSALAFKIMTDPYVGRLSFFRVYSGKLTTGSSVLNSTKNQKERIGRILQMHANHREDIEEVFSGDIAAAVGLKLSLIHI